PGRQVIDEQLAAVVVTGDQPPVPVQVQARDSSAAVTVWRQEHPDAAAGGVATVDGAIAHAAHEENGPPALGDALGIDAVPRQRVTGHRPTIQQPDDPARPAVTIPQAMPM